MLFKVECQQCGKQERVSGGMTRQVDLPVGWSGEAIVIPGLEALTLCDLCTTDWKTCTQAAVDLFNSKQGTAIARQTSTVKR